MWIFFALMALAKYREVYKVKQVLVFRFYFISISFLDPENRGLAYLYKCLELTRSQHIEISQNTHFVVINLKMQVDGHNVVSENTKID